MEFNSLPLATQAEMAAFIEIEDERRESLRQQLNPEDPNFTISQVILLNG